MAISTGACLHIDDLAVQLIFSVVLLSEACWCDSRILVAQFVTGVGLPAVGATSDMGCGRRTHASGRRSPAREPVGTWRGPALGAERGFRFSTAFFVAVAAALLKRRSSESCGTVASASRNRRIRETVSVLAYHRLF